MKKAQYCLLILTAYISVSVAFLGSNHISKAWNDWRKKKHDILLIEYEDPYIVEERCSFIHFPVQQPEPNGKAYIDDYADMYKIFIAHRSNELNNKNENHDIINLVNSTDYRCMADLREVCAKIRQKVTKRSVKLFDEVVLVLSSIIREMLLGICKFDFPKGLKMKWMHFDFKGKKRLNLVKEIEALYQNLQSFKRIFDGTGAGLQKASRVEIDYLEENREYITNKNDDAKKASVCVELHKHSVYIFEETSYFHGMLKNPDIYDVVANTESTDNCTHFDYEL